MPHYFQSGFTRSPSAVEVAALLPQQAKRAFSKVLVGNTEILKKMDMTPQLQEQINLIISLKHYESTDYTASFPKTKF